MSDAISNKPDNTPLQLTANRNYQQWRLIKDKIAEYGVVAGGLGVIAAIVLIFFYLLYVVFPLFIAAEAKSVGQYNLPEKMLGKTVFLAMEEQNEIAVRFTDTGKAVFFGVANGKTIAIKNIKIPDQTEIVCFAHGSYDTGIVAYGLSDG